MRALFRISTLLILALLAGSVTFAQRGKKKEQITVPTFPKNESGKVVYSAVVNQANDPEELHKRGKRWFGSFYKSASSVIKEDVPGDKIRGNGRFNLRITDPRTGAERNGNLILYKIEIQFKEGKYRYKIYDIKQKSNPVEPIEKWVTENTDGYNARTAEFLVQVDKYMQDLIAKLKKEMASDGAPKSDDW